MSIFNRTQNLAAAKKKVKTRAQTAQSQDSGIYKVEMDEPNAVCHKMEIGYPSNRDQIEMSNAAVQLVHCVAEAYRQVHSILVKQAREPCKELERTHQRVLELFWAVQGQIFTFSKCQIMACQIEYLTPDYHRCECLKCENGVDQMLNFAQEAQYKAFAEEMTARKMWERRGKAEEPKAEKDSGNSTKISWSPR
jgi:hypothetical protein